jgi:hypothetical protein
MAFPFTRAESLRSIAAETARMSYPSSMSRGKRPVVSGGTKAEVEKYFVGQFPLEAIWTSVTPIAKNFEQWHQTRAAEIAQVITSKIRSKNTPMCVAAKFLNTFLHQLIKYEEARPLLPLLHLPLDARVFSKLRRFKFSSLSRAQGFLTGSPYALQYEAHIKIQKALLALVAELNERPGVEFKLSSRIELNWLWL